MRELLLLKLAVPYMNPEQKDGLRIKTVEGIESESARCHKKGMSIDQILEPSYKNKDFMFILSHLGIDANKLREIVEQSILDYKVKNGENI
jgi:hypothetical protein